MNHWLFIAAAYGITLAATILVTAYSYIAMRRAEQRADVLRDRT